MNLSIFVLYLLTLLKLINLPVAHLLFVSLVSNLSGISSCVRPSISKISLKAPSLTYGPDLVAPLSLVQWLSSLAPWRSTCDPEFYFNWLSNSQQVEVQTGSLRSHETSPQFSAVLHVAQYSTCVLILLTFHSAVISISK